MKLVVIKFIYSANKLILSKYAKMVVLSGKIVLLSQRQYRPWHSIMYITNEFLTLIQIRNFLPKEILKNYLQRCLNNVNILANKQTTDIYVIF